MSLFKEWNELINEVQTKPSQKQFWKTYLQKEKDNYEKILESCNPVVEGNLAELAERYDMDPVTFVGFLDGINTSLTDPLDLNSLDSIVNNEKKPIGQDSEDVADNDNNEEQSSVDEGSKWFSEAVDLSWLNKEKVVPPLPEPTGEVVYVSNTLELLNAISKAKPNSTIMLEEGVYQLVDTLTLNKEGLTLRGAPQDRSKVVLVGRGFKGDGKFGPDMGIYINEADNITVANLTLKDFRLHAISIHGHTQPHNIHIYNVGFIDIGERSIKVSHGGPHAEGGIIEYCYFEQIQSVDPDRDDGFGANYIGGIDAHGIKDWIIRDNVFVNIRGATGGGRGAIFIWNDSIGTIVERNLIIGCDCGISIGNWHNATIEGFWHHTGGIVRNNFIFAPARQGDIYGIEIVKVRDLKVYNNTLFHGNPDYERAFEYMHPDSTMEIKNNLVHASILSREGGQAELQNNLVQVPADWFVDPQNGNLCLTDKAMEPRGAGVSLEDVPDDFFGNPRKGVYDIGAEQISTK
jgi:hypothetical protein